MAINLQDIRQACLTYMSTSVTCKIENLVADVPKAISPGEGFKFDLRATNNGDIRVIKVKYHVYISDPSKAHLIVPSFPLGGVRLARSGSTDSSPALAPGSQVAAMYLFPFDTDKKSLDPSETDVWTNIRGIAHSLGATSIRCDILAQLDLDFLFPSDAKTQQCQHRLDIV